jgi:uncharacterized membrane protein YgcG
VSTSLGTPVRDAPAGPGREPSPERGLGPTPDRASGGTTEAPAATPTARGAALAAVLALLAGLVALPAGSLLAPAPFASLLAGSLEMRDGETWRAVPEGGTVADGVELRAVGGTATLEIDGGRLVLDAGARVAAEGGRLRVDRGSVLVDDPSVRTVVVDGVLATGRGSWRVDAGVRPRLATYAGSLAADDGSAEVSLPAYRQVTVRDRAIGGATVVPLRYLATDRFDAQLLGEALRVDAVAAALARSLTGTYGEVPRDAAFYGAFVAVDADVEPALADLALVVAEDRFGPPAPVLLGVAVADAVAAVTGAPIGEALERVVRLRDQGAAWGLVLLDAGGGADDLGAAADRALAEAATDPPPTAPPAEAGDGTGAPAATVADGPATGGATPAAGGTTSGGASGGGTGSTPGGGAEGGGGSGPTAPAPDPAPPVPGVPGSPEEAVEEVGGGVAELLDEVGEEVGDTVGDAVGGVDQLLGPSLRGGPGSG